MSGWRFERTHVAETGALWDNDQRRKVGAVAVFVGEVLNQKHEQDVVLVLAGIHAATEFIAGGPDGVVEVGFFDGHELGVPLRGGARVRHTRSSGGALQR